MFNRYVYTCYTPIRIYGRCLYEGGRSLASNHIKSSEDLIAKWRDGWLEKRYSWYDSKSLKDDTSTHIVVPSEFPEAQKDTKTEEYTTNLKDYWRWSIGLPGDNRLLSDDELREMDLLVDVDGETYHLVHAPDFDLKRDLKTGAGYRLSLMIEARLEVAAELNLKRDGDIDFSRALQLQGSWLSSEITQLIASQHVSPICIDSAYIEKIIAENSTIAPLAAERALIGDARFEGSTFSGHAYFSGTTFSGIADFDQITFSGKAYFADTTFDRWARFYAATFNEQTKFANATFKGYALFDESTFSGHANFRRTKFSGEARFEHTTFSGGAIFEDSTFSKVADFPRSTFSGDANFAVSTFSEHANFSESTFSGDADFSAATFDRMAYFYDATFEEQTNFEVATFNGRAVFLQINWPDNESKIVSFSKAIFLGNDTTFEGEKFRHFEAFANTIFTGIPRFPLHPQKHDDNLQVKAFKRARLHAREEIKGKKARSSKRREIKIRHWEQLAAGYRTLKKAAQNNLDFAAVQRYYRYELMTRMQSPDAKWWEKTASFFYHWTSDYGNSIVRPFTSIAVLIIFFSAIYFGFAVSVGLVSTNDYDQMQIVGWQCWEFAWNNVFRPLSALSTEAPREGDASRLAGKLLYDYGGGFAAAVRAVATLQSLLGLTIAFLFGLSIRRRFQIE